MNALINFFDYYVGNFIRKLRGLRTKDIQYRRLLRKILKEGTHVTTPQGENALRIIGAQMRFDLKNGAPIITERDVLTAASKNSLSGVHAAIAEIVAFINGATTQEELEKYGCTWWKRWTTREQLDHCGLHHLKEGDLGEGSYGAGFHHFPTAEGIPFNQVKHIVEQIKELPYLRTHVITTWIPQYAGRGVGKQREVAVAPCHGTVLHFQVDTEKRELSLHHVQRSGDVPVGVVWNLVQYSALLLMMAQVTGYEAKELVYTISDAHIYESQIADVKALLKTRIGSLPDLVIKNRPVSQPIVGLENFSDVIGVGSQEKITNIFAFRYDDFEVNGYKPTSRRRKIWTPT